jgi:hypothetical protein
MGGETESPDCTVREFRCDILCDPLPEKFGSYRACVRAECGKIEESCIERIVKDLTDRKDASESTVTFNIKSDSEYKAQIEFYSQGRNYAWPGNGKAFDLDDYESHAFRLRCRSGEKVCFGAWPLRSSSYWGVGYNGRHGCENCCRACGADSASYVLK